MRPEGFHNFADLVIVMEEADTQHLEEKLSSQEVERVINEDAVWGWLVPLPLSHRPINLIPLKKSKVNLGREATLSPEGPSNE